MEADSSSDDEDSIPLSQLLVSPNTKTRTPTVPIPIPISAKTPKNFKKNDIVWAKIPSRSWSPAQISAITNKSTASVSLFGSNKTRLLKFSEICGFEENYAQMVRRVGAELSDEIDIALDELGRRAAMGLMCSCRRSPNWEPIGEFEPKEMVGFVKDVAVCAWVGVDDTARAVRLSAQVNGYQLNVSVCRTSGLDEGFHAENLLMFMKSVAISWGSDEWEDGFLGGEVRQIGAYRRFVCVRPDWMFRQSMEVEDGSDSEEYEGSQQDASDSSLVSDKASGVTCEWEDVGFTTEISEDGCETYQEQMQEGRVICVINRADFSILDLDEEYETMTSSQFELVVTGEDKCSENHEGDDVCSDSSLQGSDIEVVDNLQVCTSSCSNVTDTNQIEAVDNLQGDGSSQESEIDVEMACTRSFSDVADTYQIEADETNFLVIVESLNSSNCHNANHMLESTGLSRDFCQSALHGMPDITLENINLKEESITPIIEDMIPVSSEDCLRESTPYSGDKFRTSPSSKWQTHPCDEMDEFQSCAKKCIVNNHHGSQRGGFVDIMSSTYQAEASEEPLVKKRRFEQSICDVEHDIIFALSISSANNGFSETASCIGQLMRGPDSESQAISPDTTLNFDVNFESSTDHAAVSNDRDQSETLKTNSCSISQIESAEGKVAKKIRWDQFIASSESNLRDVIAPSSGKIQYSTRMRRHIKSASDEVLSHIVASKASDKAVCKPHSTGKDNVPSRIEASYSSDSYKPAFKNTSHSSDSSKPACKNTSHQNKKHNQYSPHMMRHIKSASDEVLSHIEHIVASKASYKAVCKPHSTGKDNVPSRIEASHSSDSSKPACKNTSQQNKKHNQHMVPDWRRYYVSPLVSCASKSPSKARKPSVDDKFESFPKSLHMKFPRDFDIPSKEKLAEKFEMFGPVDFSRTKVSPYTGAAQVFFLRQDSAYAAHEYVKKRNAFGQANVRFWVDQHENYRKGAETKPTPKYSSTNLKSCLKRPERNKEKRKVRFSLESKPVSVS